jgi:hypothetical protein
MDRSNALACVVVTGVLMLTAIFVVAPHHNLAVRVDQSPLLNRSDASERSGLDLRAAYDGQPLAAAITSGWVDVESADDALISVAPHSYVSLPARDWETKVGRAYLNLRMNNDRDQPEYVLLELSERVSANEVKRACKETLRGEASLADTWTVSIRAFEQP